MLAGDLLFGMSTRKKGCFFCLDAKTGETRWESDGRQGAYASILNAGNVLLFLTNGGRLLVVKPSATAFEPIAEYKEAQIAKKMHQDDKLPLVVRAAAATAVSERDAEGTAFAEKQIRGLIARYGDRFSEDEIKSMGKLPRGLRPVFAGIRRFCERAGPRDDCCAFSKRRPPRA